MLLLQRYINVNACDVNTLAKNDKWHKIGNLANIATEQLLLNSKDSQYIIPKPPKHIYPRAIPWDHFPSFLFASFVQRGGRGGCGGGGGGPEGVFNKSVFEQAGLTPPIAEWSSCQY